MRKRTVFIMVVVLALALPVIASAAPPAASTIDLPKTGQTSSYATGDDGAIQAGVAWPSPRFTDNGDGTITDNLTGLIWLKDANCANAGRTWATALSDVAELNSSGTMNGNDCGDTSNGGSHQTDWRLPNVNELESLINAEEANSAAWLNGQGFSTVQSGYYWSSSTYADQPGRAWFVIMLDGGVFSNVKSSNYYVWAVRGTTTTPAELWKTGQTTSYGTGDDGAIQAGVDWFPSTRFTDNGDGTVTDNLTGLIWLKNANCFGAQTWTQALSDANSLADGTCGLTDGSSAGDWRLPNRKELRSLIDYSQHNPPLPSGHPFINVQSGGTSSYYWSSSTYASSTGGAWVVAMDVGFVFNEGKAVSHPVWPVRDVEFYNLDISRAGTGSGTVTSSPAGIDCGGTCTAQFNSGTSVTLTATADPGSTFAGWSGDADCSDGVVTMDADKTCTATFTLNQYTITESASPSAGGSVSCSPNPVNHGSTSTCTITTNTGYTLQGVGGTCGGTLNGSTYTTNAITADCTVQATFTLNQYTITESASPSAGGSVSCSPNPVDHGSTSTCTITTNNGYTLQDVTGTCGGTLNGNTYTTNPITQDCTVVANFTLNNPVTIPSATGRGDITLETVTPGCGFYAYSAKTEADVANDPDYDYPYGLVEFRVNCPSADVTVTFPGDVSGLPYRKYGPTTPGDPATTQWYEFTNTTRSGNQVTLHLQDGVLGDDTAVDGIIVDQGGPGQPPEEVAVPTMTEWGMMIFIFLAGLGSVYYLRRRA